MDNTPQEHLEEAMALFMRYLKAYNSAERNLVRAAIDNDARISRFHSEFRDTAADKQISIERNQFLHIGFMLAADPRPEECAIKAELFFKSMSANELRLSEKTYGNAVMALHEYADRLAQGEFKATMN